MLLTPLLPVAGPARDISTDAGRAWLSDVYAPPAAPSLRLNMITTLTGSAVGIDGTSDTISSRVDRAVLGVIRGHADVVLVGAATVRAEGYLVPRTARLAVLTSTGDLGAHRLRDDADRVLLVAPASAADAVRARAALPGARVLGVPGPGRPSAGAVLAALRAAGLAQVVCEGGPAVAALFALAGLVDEYCVSVAPAIVPAAAPFLALPPEARVDTAVAGMLVDDAGFSYLRLRSRTRARDDAATP